MDWFQRWPKDALIAVSNHFLANYDVVCTPQVKLAVVQEMGEFQVIEENQSQLMSSVFTMYCTFTLVSERLSRLHIGISVITMKISSNVM